MLLKKMKFHMLRTLCGRPACSAYARPLVSTASAVMRLETGRVLVATFGPTRLAHVGAMLRPYHAFIQRLKSALDNVGSATCSIESHRDSTIGHPPALFRNPRGVSGLGFESADRRTWGWALPSNGSHSIAMSLLRSPGQPDTKQHVATYGDWAHGW